MPNKILRPGSNGHTELPPRPEPAKVAATLSPEWITEYDRIPAAVAKERAENDPEYARRVMMLLAHRGVVR